MDELNELALFLHVYPGRDPDEETLATFYGLIACIPDPYKKLWGFGRSPLEEDMEAMANQAIDYERLEYTPED